MFLLLCYDSASSVVCMDYLLLAPRKSGTVETEHRDPPLPEYFKIPVLYRDENIIIVDKPYDIRIDGDFPVTVEKLVRVGRGISMDKFRLCNQLDYSTSGALVLGLSKKGTSKTNELFSNRKTNKWYIALGEGVWCSESLDPVIVSEKILELKDDFRMAIDNEKGQDAHTIVTPLKSNILFNDKLCTLFLVKLITGRRHQIRLHLKHIGFPIVGDATYHCRPASVCRMMLHAWRIELPFSSEYNVKVTATGEGVIAELLTDKAVQTRLAELAIVS